MNEQHKVPTPGRDGAPSDASDPADDVVIDEEADTITRKEESSVGPGAGASPIVRVTAPIQHEDHEATKHPTLGEDEES